MKDRLVELYRYRELIRNLVLRDLKVRYRNSILGVLWSLGNPLLMMTVFTFVFTIMMPKNTYEKFPVFVLCAILPWNFFSSAVMGSVNSVVGNAHLIKKVYFPREVLPVSTVLSGLVNFVLALVALFVVMAAFQVRLTPWALYLPLVILIQVAFSLGVCFFVATINVFYRDVAVISEVIMLAWFFLSPVLYTYEDFIPQYSRLMYVLNPIGSIISTYRMILYNGAPPAPDFVLRTLITSVAVMLAGYLFFARYSRWFGEEL